MATVQSLKWNNIGIHLSFEKRIFMTIKLAIESGLYSFQFFMGNPQSYKRQRISDDDIQESNRLLNRFPTHIFTHFPYIANLNGSVSSLAWNGDKKIDDTMSLVLNEISYELSVLSQLNSITSGIVIHPGCYPDRQVGLETIAKSINKINFRGKPKLLLENCAGEGRKLCKNFSEFKVIYSLIENEKKDNIGFCIDTAHIWGQGDYDLRKTDEVKRMFDEFDFHMGLDKLSLVHLNDSEVHFGSKKDRHAVLGTGYIWGKDMSSLVYLLNFCNDRGIPIVIETNCMSLCVLHQLQREIE